MINSNELNVSMVIWVKPKPKDFFLGQGMPYLVLDINDNFITIKSLDIIQETTTKKITSEFLRRVSICSEAEYISFTKKMQGILARQVDALTKQLAKAEIALAKREDLDNEIIQSGNLS